PTAASPPVALLVARILQYARLLVPYWLRASAPSVHLPILRRALRARREIARAFGHRCIVASGVARRSNTPVCSTPRALLASRIGALGAPGYFAAGPKRGGAAGRTRPKPTARGGRALGLTRWCPTRTRQRIRSLIVGLDSGRLAFLPHWSRRPICHRCLLILSRWYR